MAARGQRQRGGGALMVLTVVAAPGALGFETLLRHLLVPPEFEAVRVLLRPHLTPVAWTLAALCAIASVAALWMHRRAILRAAANVPPGADAAEHVHRAGRGAFMLAATVPQVPAILATFTFMFGAPLPPVLLAVGVVTAAVVTLALRSRPRG